MTSSIERPSIQIKNKSTVRNDITTNGKYALQAKCSRQKQQTIFYPIMDFSAQHLHKKAVRLLF